MKRLSILFAALVGLTVLLSACEGDPVTTENGESRPSITAQIGTQDIWIFDSFRVLDEAGTATDITDEILAEAESSLGPPVSLNGGFTFGQALSIQGRVTDENGELLPSITMMYGVLSDDTDKALVGISSPDLGQERVNIDDDDLVDIDLSFLASVDVGDTVEMDFVFAQTLSPADPSTEDGLTHLEILAQRWNTGNLQFTAIESDGELQMAGIFGLPVTIVEGSKVVKWVGKTMIIGGTIAAATIATFLSGGSTLLIGLAGAGGALVTVGAALKDNHKDFESAPTATPEPTPEPAAGYAVFLMTNVSGGSIWAGAESDLKGSYTCNFQGGGLCAGGGADTPVEYVKKSADFETYEEAKEAYCQALESEPEPVILTGGSKAKIFGAEYWVSSAPSCE